MSTETLDFKITVEAAAAQADISKFNSKISELEEKLGKANKGAEGFQDEIKKLSSKITDLETRLSKTNTRTDDFGARQEKAKNIVEEIDKKIAKYEKDLNDLSDAMVKGSGNTAAYTQVMRALESELDKLEGKQKQIVQTTEKLTAPASPSGIPALGGVSKNAGQNVLILSQAVDDAQYGLKGVINNVPQVVAAVGGSMGLAGAFGIAAVAVSLWYDRWKEYDAAQKETIKNEGLWRDALVDTDKLLRSGVLKSTEDLKQQLIDLQTEVKNFGKTTRQINEQVAREQISANETSIATLEKNLPALRQEAERMRSSAGAALALQDPFFQSDKELKEKAQTAISIYETAKKRLEENKKSLQEQKDTLAKIVSEAEKLDKLEKEKEEREERQRRGKQLEKDLRKKQDENEKWLREAPERILKAREEADAKAEAETERNMREIIDLEQLFADQELAIYRKTEKEKTKIKKEEDKKRKKIEEDTNDFYVSTQQMLLGQLASSTSNYIQAKIEGEKDAERKAIAGFLKATGQQLVASGTRAVFEGVIANAAIPGSGVPLMVAGGAAIAAGVGMGAGGAAVMPKEPPRSKEASRERGASSFSGRSSRGDGGTNLTIVYGGISGPTADQGSRALMSAWSRARRRGYA